MRFRVTLLAVVIGLAASLAASLLLPRLELDWCDTFLFYYQDWVMGHVPPDPRIVMAAKLEVSREIPDIQRLLKKETEVSDWGAAQDAALLERLMARGAAGVCFRRPYGSDTPEARGRLAAACQKQAGLVGSHFLRTGKDGSYHRKSDLPQELAEVRPPTTVDSLADRDGTSRRVYLALYHEGKAIPSAALVFFARLNGVPLEQIRYEATGIAVGSRFFACERDEEGYLYFVLWPVLQTRAERELVNVWEGPVSVRRLLLERRHGLYELIKGRVVFIGDALNQAVDERRTPFGKLDRFQVQAALLDTLLRDWSMSRPPWWQSLLLQALLLLLMTLRLVQQTHWLHRLLTALLAAALYLALAQGFFCWGHLVPVTGPLLGILAALAVVTLAQSDAALRALERYGGAAARLAGARMVESTFTPFERVATIMFTNLPDHLKDLERLGSQDLFARRKEYSESVIRIIRRHEGRILDFQADFIMTGFNVEATKEDPDHALRAVRAALELEAEVGDLKDRWLEALDPAALKAYCGICTGLVAIGWVGAKEKQSPAAIGDTTNVAARLLGAAKKMGVDILVSEPTMQYGQGKIVADPLPPVSLKGKTHPVPIFHARELSE